MKHVVLLACLVAPARASTVYPEPSGSRATPVVRPPVQGFQAGDYYVASSEGTHLIDPDTGQVTLVNSLSADNAFGRMVYDPRRKGLVFVGGPPGGTATGIYILRPDGNTEELAVPAWASQGLSLGKNGRIYVLNPSSSTLGDLQYLESDDTLHDVLDAATGLAYVCSPAPSNNTDGLTYHAGTNALYYCTYRGVPNTCTGSGFAIVVQKLPLSADGTEVVGPVTCTTVPDPASTYQLFPREWSRTPAGKLLLVTTGIQSSTAIQPRVFEIDPVSLAVSTFASPGGYSSAHLTAAGAWSWTEQRVAILDIGITGGGDALRFFGQGESGSGQVLSLSHDFSSGNWSLVQIPFKLLQKPLLSPIAIGGRVALPILSAGEDSRPGSLDIAVEGAASGAVGVLRLWIERSAWEGEQRLPLMHPLALPLVADALGQIALTLPLGAVRATGSRLVLEAEFLDAGAASVTASNRLEIVLD